MPIYVQMEKNKNAHVTMGTQMDGLYQTNGKGLHNAQLFAL